jgi:hypothetical protein
MEMTGSKQIGSIIRRYIICGKKIDVVKWTGKQNEVEYSECDECYGA